MHATAFLRSAALLAIGWGLGLAAAAVSTTASNSQPALTLLILPASEEAQAVLKGHGLAAP